MENKKDMHNLTTDVLQNKKGGKSLVPEEYFDKLQICKEYFKKVVTQPFVAVVRITEPALCKLELCTGV